MRFFLLISTILLCSGCSSLKFINDFEEVKPVSGTRYATSLFKEPDKGYLYKANINVYGREFGGLIVIKKNGHQNFRIAFTTEFGNKLIDLGYDNGELKLNYAIEELNKKIIINTLKRDFAILLAPEIDVEKEYENDKYKLIQGVQENRFNYYFINKPGNRLDKIINASKRKEKIIVKFDPYENNVPEQINIEHQNIKLNIFLYLLKRL